MTNSKKMQYLFINFEKLTFVEFRITLRPQNLVRPQVNPYHIKFLKWNNPSYLFGTVHYHFKGYQDENLKLDSQQYRAWSDCMDVQAGLAQYCWQRLITFGVGKIRVKTN